MSGLLEGLTTRDLSVKDFRAVCSNLQTKFIPNFVQNLATEVSKLPEVPEVELPVQVAPVVQVPARGADRVRASLSSGKTLQQQLEEIRGMLNAAPKLPDPEDDEPEEEETEEETAERLENERQQAQVERERVEDVGGLRVITALRAKRSLMPTRFTRTSLYAIVKVPLVPVFPDNFKLTDERTLSGCAIKHTIIQGYAFLEDQLVLCISRTEVDKMNAAKVDSNRDTSVEKVAGAKGLHGSAEKRAVKLANEANVYSDELFTLNREINPLGLVVAKLKAELAAATLIVKGGKTKDALGKEIVKKPTTDAVRLARYTSKMNEAASKLKPLQPKLLALVRKADDLKERLANARASEREQEAVIEKRRVDLRNTRKLLKPKAEAVTPVDYAMSVLAHVNEISAAAYTLVTNEFKVNVRNADILCFWIMPAAKLNRWFRDAGGKTKVQWSFPWDA